MNSFLNNGGCSERFAELCALASADELTIAEAEELRLHVAQCSPCAELLREFKTIHREGVTAFLAESESTPANAAFDAGLAEARLVDALHAGRTQDTPDHLRGNVVPLQRRWGTWAVPAAAAAAVLIGAFIAYQAGAAHVRHTNAVQAHAAPVASPMPVTPVRQDAAIPQPPPDDTGVALRDSTEKVKGLEQQVATLTAEKEKLSGEVSILQVSNDQAMASARSSEEQRASLQKQLDGTAKSLQLVQDELDTARREKDALTFRVASMDRETTGLRASLAVVNTSATSSDRLLADDRDIRELMGARQLYIADVFDVQNNGERSKSFGRIFYTKGKSLVFYAFDLQTHPGLRDTQTYQAWGKPENPSGKPISLGIFYVDNEQNRRWALKSDNPDVLAQINAVFVTAEPHGGSIRPTGKPFLEAYLHSLPPNHP